jgi:hypothetical protein
VSTRDPTECPQTNVLLAMPSKDACPEEIAGAGGKWVGGWLLRAPHSENDPRPHLCSYFWEAPARNAPDTRVLPNAEGAWQWDCPRVAAHGDYAAMNQALAELGRAHLGSIEWKSNAPPDPVRIAVVDTAAGSWQDPDNNPHGRAVGALALDTACPDAASCNTSVENFLGLPLYRDRTPNGGAVIRRDIQHGGAFGAPGHVARAILDAVNAAPDQRTILNLSLAYESDELPASLLPKRTDLANRAVLEALRYARCHGALILAAAGNGPVPAEPGQAPGLPARWTALPGLSEKQCRERFGIAHQASADVPLLYAVSGHDFNARPLLTTREAGQSVFAALGFAAVREEPNGGYTRILTGTSVATAAVSGIAALLWGHAGDMSPDRVMRELYAGSKITTISPDFNPFEPALAAPSFDTVRRITRCSIASPALGLAVCTELADPIAALPANTLPGLPAGAPELLANAPTEPRRGVSPWTFPFVFPQPPGEPACGTCTWRFGPHRLDLALRPSFPVGTVSNMQLLASGASFAGVAALSSGTSGVTPIADIIADTDPFSVLLEEGLVVTSAELTYEIDIDGVPVDVTESVVLEAAAP